MLAAVAIYAVYTWCRLTWEKHEKIKMRHSPDAKYKVRRYFSQFEDFGDNLDKIQSP